MGLTNDAIFQLIKTGLIVQFVISIFALGGWWWQYRDLLAWKKSMSRRMENMRDAQMMITVFVRERFNNPHNTAQLDAALKLLTNWDDDPTRNLTGG